MAQLFDSYHYINCFLIFSAVGGIGNHMVCRYAAVYYLDVRNE